MLTITLGRPSSDKEKFGTKGCIFLGKTYVRMGHTMSLSNEVWMDVTGAHAMLICGKRGGGKSYTMGVIAEGFGVLDDDVKSNLSIILLDTMGIYWTMKYPNHRQEEMLKDWGIKGQPFDVKIFTPEKFYYGYKEKGIPTDFPFAIKPSELSAQDWCQTFEIESTSPVAVFIERIIFTLKKQNPEFSMDDLIEAARNDMRAEKEVKDTAENRFLSCKEWGLFSQNGTEMKDLAMPGQITVLDVSCYVTMPGGWKIKTLVVGLVCQKLFVERMLFRKGEEFKQVHGVEHFFAEEDTSGLIFGKPKEEAMPLVWVVIDEAHEFLPREGTVSSSGPLITILREGRQPGISLILATQQPGKIHTDVMTQSDIVLSMRLTAKLDMDALGALAQSYMRGGLTRAMDNLPRQKGSALVLDDQNERLYSLKIRPRMSWHGGASPSAMPSEKKEITL